MAGKANKSLLVSFHETVVYAARVSNLSKPITVEAVDSMKLNGNSEKIAEFFGDLCEIKPGQFINSVIGVYPDSRLIRRATLESPNKAKDPSFLPDYLQNQFKVSLDEFSVTVLNAQDGREFDPVGNLTKELLFIGAETQELLDLQRQVTEYGLFPVRLEVNTLPTVGGLVYWSQQWGVKSPVLYVELNDRGAQTMICREKGLDVSRPIPFGFDAMLPIVQSELGLKDEDNARRLFYSETFDFAEMGPVLLKKLVKELQASTGFYEVQTGQTIGQLYMSALPKQMRWVERALIDSLGTRRAEIDILEWCEKQDIKLDESLGIESTDTYWLDVFSLAGDY